MGDLSLGLSHFIHLHTLVIPCGQGSRARTEELRKAGVEDAPLRSLGTSHSDVERSKVYFEAFFIHLTLETHPFHIHVAVVTV